MNTKPAHAPAPPPAAGLVKDGNTASFVADVVEASQRVPVIVDLWAPWSGPCKQFGPLLEKAVREAGGRVRLVKINIDENRQIAQALQAQSVPAVFVFARGQPVDGFMGALPESQIKAFVTGCMQLLPPADGLDAAPDPASMQKQADAFLADGKHDHAAALYHEILRLEPERHAAVAGLIRALLGLGRHDEARALYGGAPAALREGPLWENVEKAMGLAEKTAGLAPSSELRVKLEADPADHQARHDYALALYAEGNPGAAVDELLEIMRRNRNWNGDAARKELLSIFDTLGFADPVAVEGRRKLSSILFS